MHMPPYWMHMGTSMHCDLAGHDDMDYPALMYLN